MTPRLREPRLHDGEIEYCQWTGQRAPYEREHIKAMEGDIGDKNEADTDVG